jgi:hypothetical protein
MKEKANYYHIWEKGTPVEKSLVIKVIDNSYCSMYPISVDDFHELIIKIKFTLKSGNPTVDEKYNLNKISENRAFKKMWDYQRGINLPYLK